jgi:hypothetical protein
MASVLAIVSKAVFEKMIRGTAAKPGDVLPVDRYTSTNPGLEPLRDGGSLFLVTVRPPDEELWLVGVLESPRFERGEWKAAPNVVPITGLAPVKAKLQFASGTGIKAKAGALGMSLQTPRELTPADVALLRGGKRPAPPAAKPPPSTNGTKAGGWRVLRTARVDASPQRLVPRGPDRWLLQGKPGSKVIEVDGELAVTGSLPSKAWGQVSASADGRRVGVATMNSIHVFGDGGKRDVALDTVDWWEHCSGGIAFAGDGSRAWFTCVPDDEENESEARCAVCVLDVTRKKRIGFTPLEFEQEAHMWLYPLRDGRSALLWANAQQDAQEYWLVTGVDGDPQVKRLKGPSGRPFAEQLDERDAFLVTSFRSVAWHAAKDGKQQSKINFEDALAEEDEQLVGAAEGEGELLLLADAFVKGKSRLAIGGKGGSLRNLDVPGLPAGRPQLLQAGPGGRALVSYRDGNLVLLGSG